MWIGGSLHQFFLNPDTPENKVHQNMENPTMHAYRSMKINNALDNSTEKSESKKIHASMARMQSNAESTRRDFGYRSKLTNWILDSGATCHMLGGRLQFSLTLPIFWVNTRGKYSPDNTHGINPGICLLRYPRLITLTLNFQKGNVTPIYSWGDFTLHYFKMFPQ